MATIKDILGSSESMTFNAADYGLDSLNLVDYVEFSHDVEDDGWTVRVQCSDGLAFHAERYPELFEVEDDSVEFTTAAWDGFCKIFEARYSSGDIDVVWDTSGDSSVSFEVYTTVRPWEDDADAVNYLWDVLARIANEFDPGTFGSEYFFSILNETVKEA